MVFWFITREKWDRTDIGANQRATSWIFMTMTGRIKRKGRGLNHACFHCSNFIINCSLYDKRWKETNEQANKNYLYKNLALGILHSMLVTIGGTRGKEHYIGVIKRRLWLFLNNFEVRQASLLNRLWSLKYSTNTLCCWNFNLYLHRIFINCGRIYSYYGAWFWILFTSVNCR